MTLPRSSLGALDFCSSRLKVGGVPAANVGSQTMTLDHVKTDLLVTHSKRKESFSTDNIAGRILWLMKNNSTIHFLRDYDQGFKDESWIASNTAISKELGRLVEKEFLGKKIVNKQNSYFLSPNVTFIEN